jgi:Undecaprenyl-phosphate galactose phosphotransferase WbaP
LAHDLKAIDSEKLSDSSLWQHIAPQSLPTFQIQARPNLFITGAIFLLFDLLSLVSAALLAQLLWVSLIDYKIPPLHYFWPAIVLFVAIFWFKGLYPGVGITPVEQLKLIVRGASFVYLFWVASIFLVKEANATSRGVLTLAWMLSVIFLPLTRSMVCRLCAAKTWWGAPIIILGASKTAELLIRGLKERPSIGFKPIVCLDDNPSKIGHCENVPVAGSFSLAAEFARRYRIRHAILAIPGVQRDRMLVLLERCSAIFPHVILIPDLFGVSTLWVETRDLSGMLGLEMRFNLLIPLNRWLKRLVDVIVALIGLICTAPLLAFCMVWIKLSSPGCALYFQDREGFGGKTIRIPKLRTMYHNADKILEDYLRANPSAKSEWDRHCKLKNDPRVLPLIGRFLRRTSVDELPQLWSIVKGDMSLVGPRPFPSYHTEKFSREFSVLRQGVVPGLTGLWQITDRSNAGIEAQMQLDSYYIRNWSIWMDIYIFCRTAQAVISGNGAY